MNTIWPGSVRASLGSANHALSNLSGSVIKPIRDSISEFDGDSVLQGDAFASLRSHMDGEISQGLLTQLETAVDALIAANEQHDDALEIITEYGFIDLAQMDQDEARIRENINFASNNLFSGGEDWLNMLNEELEYIRRKRRDYWLYVGRCSGIYNGLFAGLGNLTARMNLATFCPSSGVVVVPLVIADELAESMRAYFDKDGKLTEEGWAIIEEILGRSAADICGHEFYALMQVFVEMGYGGDLTRFISLLGYSTGENYVRFNAPEDIRCTTWQLCSDKLGEFIAILYAMYLIEYDRQRIVLEEFHVDCPTSRPNTVWEPVAPILERLVMMNMLNNAQLQENTSFGGGGEFGPNITIISSDGGFYFSFYLAKPPLVGINPLQHGGTGFGGTHYTVPNHFFVHNTALSEGATDAIVRDAENHFNYGSTPERIGSAVVLATVEAAVKKGVSAVISSNPATITASIIADVNKTISGENKEAQQTMGLIDSFEQLVIAAGGAMHVVVVTPIDSLSYDVHIFPTFYTTDVENTQTSPSDSPDEE